MTIRTLVLSGGGGRGAFHAGVYKYLSIANKTGLDEQHSGIWKPDIIVGTSIGAVNGAAITQGMTAAELERFWLSLRERDVQGLPPGMGWLARRVANMILKPSIGTRLNRIPAEVALSPSAEESWPPLPILPAWLSKWLIGRWSNLLDTAPLYDTLYQRMSLDEQKIAYSEITLLISATNVRTGEAAIFSNRDIINPRTGQNYDYVRKGITGRRIIASCSIPVVYPWTADGKDVYWDGAVVTNTPLGPAFDAARSHPIDEPMEAVVVMMTPWWESGETAPEHGVLPKDFGEALTWMLDWALLASFRSDLKLARALNKMVKMTLENGQQPAYRLVNEIIVAPDQFLPVTRIIDYDSDYSAYLIALGEAAAERAFKRKFGIIQ